MLSLTLLMNPPKKEESSQNTQTVMNVESKKLSAVLQHESDVISPPVISKQERQREARFKMTVERLQEFKNKFGHTNVLHENCSSQSQWCSGIRRGSVTMTEVRKELLREVGFDFGGNITENTMLLLLLVMDTPTKMRILHKKHITR